MRKITIFIGKSKLRCFHVTMARRDLTLLQVQLIGLVYCCLTALSAQTGYIMS